MKFSEYVNLKEQGTPLGSGAGQSGASMVAAGKPATRMPTPNDPSDKPSPFSSSGFWTKSNRTFGKNNAGGTQELLNPVPISPLSPRGLGTKPPQTANKPQQFKPA